MINKDASIIIDIDGTICNLKTDNESYHDLLPRYDIIRKLNLYKSKGYYVILFTSRNMNTFKNNLGLINKHTAPVLIEWLNKYEVPYDELIFGKPWPNKFGFYVDDRAIRPDEFLSLSEQDIHKLLNNKYYDK